MPIPLKALQNLGRTCLARGAVAAILTSVLAIDPSVGQPMPGRDAGDAKAVFDIDDPPDLNYELFDGFYFGGEVVGEVIEDRNFDLDGDSRGDDQAVFTSELALAFFYDQNPIFDAFVELHLERTAVLASAGMEQDQDLKLIIDEAYLTVPDVIGDMSVRIGRGRIRDRREWLLDQELDGVRVFGQVGEVGLDLSATRFRLVAEDLLNSEERENINNYLAMAHYAPAKGIKTSAFVFLRDDRDRTDNDLLFVGVQGVGRPNEDWELWLDAAHVRGREDGKSVRGYALDTGVIFSPDLPLEPSATLGFAFGTGDGDPDDGIDHAFRQTGLHENRDAFNGVTRFSYYGEAFDPELSNLAILTAGVGLKPTKHSSIDLVYHRYWQPAPADFLRDSAFHADPGGRKAHLGDEIDLVVGVSEIEDVDIELALGAFFPGAAFEGPRDPAFVGRLEVVLEF